MSLASVGNSADGFLLLSTSLLISANWAKLSNFNGVKLIIMLAKCDHTVGGPLNWTMAHKCQLDGMSVYFSSLGEATLLLCSM